MPENPRPTAALRLSRPYSSADEFIENDLPMVGRSWVILPGLPARAPGELIRFEIVLADGQPVLRGEGTVVAHHAAGGARPPGLEVKIARIDARSKGMLDRVHARRLALMRDESAGGSDAEPVSRSPASLLVPESQPPPSIARRVSAPPPQATRTVVASPSAVPPPVGEPHTGTAVPTRATDARVPVRTAPDEASRSGGSLENLRRRGPVAPPSDRDDALARLRQRAKHLASGTDLAENASESETT